MPSVSASFCAICWVTAASLAACSAAWATIAARVRSMSLTPAVDGGSSCGGASLSSTARNADSLATSSCADSRSWLTRRRSASVTVPSSSIRTCPAVTWSPSRTWIACTIPVSRGWMVLVRADGTILPDAVAMMSTLPTDPHTSARRKNAMMVPPTARPTGEAGVSRISSAAGRNCSAMRIVRFHRHGLRRRHEGLPGCPTGSGAGRRSALHVSSTHHACRLRRYAHVRW